MWVNGQACWYRVYGSSVKPDLALLIGVEIHVVVSESAFARSSICSPMHLDHPLSALWIHGHPCRLPADAMIDLLDSWKTDEHKHGMAQLCDLGQEEHR